MGIRDIRDMGSEGKLKALSAFDEQHHGLTTEVETLTRQLEVAQIALEGAQLDGCRSAERLLRVFRNVFKGGFVIEEVVRPEEMRYRAEAWDLVRDYRLDDSTTIGEDHLDETHVSRLRGRFIQGHYFEPRLSVPLSEPASGLALHNDVGVSFDVVGQEKDIKLPVGVDWKKGRGGPQPITLRYEGPLSAMQWRLPTEEEVGTFGQQAVQTV